MNKNMIDIIILNKFEKLASSLIEDINNTSIHI